MITTLHHVPAILQPLKTKGATIVLVTGVFDVLHDEHFRFLQKAKAAGDYLLVGIETDRRVRIMKGEDRPINPQAIRLEKLVKLPFVDLVFLLPELFDQPAHHDQLISLLKPDILAISSHTDHQPEKQRIMSKHGGKVVIVHQLNPALSTTKLITKK